MPSFNRQNKDEANTSSARVEIISIPIHPNSVYTLKEAAELTKCSYSTIRRAIETGNLEIVRIGNQPRILGTKLLEWIHSGGVTGRSKTTM